jgi:hypothetical protein
MANRGDLFEVIFASAVTARFERRFKSVGNNANKKINPNATQNYQLPRVTNADVKKVLREVVPIINRKTSRTTQVQDVVDTGENLVFDNIRVRVSVPAAAARYLSSQSPNFSDLSDMIIETTRLANNHPTLNSRSKNLAINGKTDVIIVEAAGTKNQRTVKADVKVKVRTGGKTQRGFPDFSLKVPGGEQFSQVSGGSYDKFEQLFSQMGVTLDSSVNRKWIQSFNNYLSEDVFSRRFASKQAIYSAKIPLYLKNNAARVYISAYRQIRTAFSQNSPVKRRVLRYIYDGFTRGVDTELVKLTGDSSRITGFKRQVLNPEFFSKMLSYDYDVSFVRESYKSGDLSGAGKTPMIILSAFVPDDPQEPDGPKTKRNIFSIRYKWENAKQKISRNFPQTTYKIYPRHYLEAMEGFFYL